MSMRDGALFLADSNGLEPGMKLVIGHGGGDVVRVVAVDRARHIVTVRASWWRRLWRWLRSLVVQ